MVVEKHKRSEPKVISTTMVSDNFERSKYQDGVIASLFLSVENNG